MPEGKSPEIKISRRKFLQLAGAIAVSSLAGAGTGTREQSSPSPSATPQPPEKTPAPKTPTPALETPKPPIPTPTPSEVSPFPKALETAPSPNSPPGDKRLIPDKNLTAPENKLNQVVVLTRESLDNKATPTPLKTVNSVFEFDGTAFRKLEVKSLEINLWQNKTGEALEISLPKDFLLSNGTVRGRFYAVALRPDGLPFLPVHKPDNVIAKTVDEQAKANNNMVRYFLNAGLLDAPDRYTNVFSVTDEQFDNTLAGGIEVGIIELNQKQNDLQFVRFAIINLNPSNREFKLYKVPVEPYPPNSQSA